MAAYYPPIENVPIFNQSLFIHPTDTSTTSGLTASQASQLFLSKKNNDTSTSSLTTFNGEVTIKGTQQFGVQGIGGGITNINRRLRFQDINGNATGYGDMLYGSGPELVISSYPSALTLLQTYIRFQTCPAGSATPTLKLEIGDTTKILNSLEVGTSGVSGTSRFKHVIQCYDVIAPYSNFNQFYTTGSSSVYNMIGTSTQHSFYTYNSVPTQIRCFDIQSTQNISRVPLTFKEGTLGPQCQIYQSGNDLKFENTTNSAFIRFYTSNTLGTLFNSLNIDYNGVTCVYNLYAYRIQTNLPTGANSIFTNLALGSTLTIGHIDCPNTFNGATTFNLSTTFNNRLIHAATSYSYPFSTQTTQGYYLKQTGSAYTTLVSNTYTSILTCPTQLVLGVWRIDWSCQNTITAGGTITAEHTLVSTSINSNTPVSFTGSQIKNHISQNYSSGDIQLINGSFTLNLSASTTLYLTINRVFSSGSYSFIGEIAATRIA